MNNYLIWSNAHRAWWRQNGRGYTTVIQWAGVYGELEARQIVADVAHERPITATDYYGMYIDQAVPHEVLVPLTADGHPGGPYCPPMPQIIPVHIVRHAVHGVDCSPGCACRGSFAIQPGSRCERVTPAHGQCTADATEAVEEDADVYGLYCGKHAEAVHAEQAQPH